MPRVLLAGFGASSIDIEARAYIDTTSVHEFMAVQAELLAMIMRAVEEAGTSMETHAVGIEKTTFEFDLAGYVEDFNERVIGAYNAAGDDALLGGEGDDVLWAGGGAGRAGDRDSTATYSAEASWPGAPDGDTEIAVARVIQAANNIEQGCLARPAGPQDDHLLALLHPEAAAWLARLGLKGIGLDTPSPDPLDSTDYPAHLALDAGEPRASGKVYKISAVLQDGLTSDQAKRVAKIVRDGAPKGVKATQMGDEVRVSSKKRDDLQETIALLKGEDFDFAVLATGLGEVPVVAGELVEAAQQAIAEITGDPSELSTSGGTSDGRFIAPTGAQVL